jgi:hypothetical protein
VHFRQALPLSPPSVCCVQVTVEHAEVSEEHRYFTYIGKAMQAWSKAVHLGMLQRAALLKVLESSLLREHLVSTMSLSQERFTML